MSTLTFEDVAKALIVSVRTVEAFVASGELPAINVSRKRDSRKQRLRITQAALDSFLAARTTGAPSRKPAARKRRIDCPSYI